MRQNSKGLSHTHARTQTHSRGRGTKAQPKKIHSRRTMQKLLDVLPPAPLVLPCSLCIPPAPAASSCLHLLPFSILLPLPTFLMLSDDYSKCKSQAHVCVCEFVFVCLESFAAMLASQPQAPHRQPLHSFGSCWQLLLAALCPP